MDEKERKEVMFTKLFVNRATKRVQSQHQQNSENLHQFRADGETGARFLAAAVASQ